jgi:hypothetical protein
VFEQPEGHPGYAEGICPTVRIPVFIEGEGILILPAIQNFPLKFQGHAYGDLATLYISSSYYRKENWYR